MTEKQPWLPQDPREEKLPKWTQELLRQLRMLIRDREERIHKLTPSHHMDSGVCLNPYGTNNYGVPEDTRIQFSLKGTDWWGDQITVHMSEKSHVDGKVLNVQGGKGLIVLPSSSNHLYIATAAY